MAEPERPKAQTEGAAPPASTTHLVLIPSYNPGVKLRDTLHAARAHWSPVWVVVDGSTDGSADWLRAQAAQDPGLRVIALPENRGKGAAVLHGVELAAREGFTHALTMDSDGQHPAELIEQFMHASQAAPQAMVLGVPQFGAEAPRIRVLGRKVSNGWANLETLGAGIGDSLFGFRVYPLAPLARVLHATRFARRYDFDPEVAVRLLWTGTPVRNIPATCRYLTRDEGGVSHFHYLRDNLRMIGLHTRLLVELVFWRWPSLLRQRRRAP